MSILAILLGLLLILLSWIVRKWQQKLNYFKTLGIPHEKPHFLMGSLKGVRTQRSFAEVWQQYYDKFKHCGLPFVGYYNFLQPNVFVVDKELVRHILINDFNKFVNRGMYSNPDDDPLTGHLFSLDGQKWRSMRKRLSPTFSSGKMKFMFSTVLQVAQQFEQVLEQLVLKNPIIEVKELLTRFTTDVIGSCAFGIECNSLKDAEAEFYVMGRKSFKDMRHGVLGSLFILSFMDLARKWHMKVTPDHIEEFFMRIVRETVQLREQQHIKRNDFMDILIELKNNKNLTDEHGEPLGNLTLQELAAQCFVFFLAGLESSSAAMGFALYELAKNEQLQQKARAEILEVLQQHNEQFSYEAVKQMLYLQQILAETLRLYTPLGLLHRVALEDYAVPNHTNLIIKKGMRVIIPNGAMHRDERYYEQPLQFDPERFSAANCQKRDNIVWLPFGDGPRNCIGLRFGQMQSRIGLAMLLKNFKFSVCEQTAVPMVFDKKSFVIAPEKGIFLKLEKLEN